MTKYLLPMVITVLGCTMYVLFAQEPPRTAQQRVDAYLEFLDKSTKPLSLPDFESPEERELFLKRLRERAAAKAVAASQNAPSEAIERECCEFVRAQIAYRGHTQLLSDDEVYHSLRFALYRIEHLENEVAALRAAARERK